MRSERVCKPRYSTENRASAMHAMMAVFLCLLPAGRWRWLCTPDCTQSSTRDRTSHTIPRLGDRSGRPRGTCKSLDYSLAERASGGNVICFLASTAFIARAVSCCISSLWIILSCVSALSFCTTILGMTASQRQTPTRGVEQAKVNGRTYSTRRYIADPLRRFDVSCRPD